MGFWKGRSKKALKIWLFSFEIENKTTKKPRDFSTFFVTLRLLGTFPKPTLILTMKTWHSLRLFAPLRQLGSSEYIYVGKV